MNSCRDITKLTASGLKLTLLQRVSVAVHLLLCKACRRFKAQSEAIDEAIRASETQVQLDDAARTRIRKQIQGE